METVELLGISFTNANLSQVVEQITIRLKDKKDKWFVATPNPEMVVFSQTHNRFKEILNKAEVVLPDGVGIIWAAKILGKPLRARVTGVDCMLEVCRTLAKETGTIGLLGGMSDVAEKTGECLKRKYPGLQIGFTGREWDDSLLRVKHIDILFVAYGFPKQEEWIYKNLASIPVTAAMGVGGAFDYISGEVPRAPRLIQVAGFEWLFRLICQPWRFKRQLALLIFVWLVIKDRFFPDKNNK